jgi:hypothetical protein
MENLRRGTIGHECALRMNGPQTIRHYWSCHFFLNIYVSRIATPLPPCRGFQDVGNLSKTTATSGIVADSPFKSPNGNFLLFADIALSISITSVGHA